MLSARQEPRGDDWEGSLAIRRLVRGLVKRKVLILSIFLVVVVPAAIGTYIATPLYRSFALVQVNPDSVQVLPYRDVADTGGATANYDNYVGTQERILTGTTLRTRVIRRLQSGDFEGQPASLEVARLGENYSVRKIERSDLFELAYLSPDAEAAAKVVNIVAEEYVKQNFEMRQDTRTKAEQNLKKELDALEGRLQLSEKELTSYAQNNDILSIEPGQIDPLQERLRTLNQDYAQSEGLVAAAKSSFDSLSGVTAAAFPQRLISTQIGELERKLLTVDQELTSLRSTFGENWPAVVEKRNEAALVRDQLTREKSVTLSRELEQARLDLESAESRRSLSLRALDDQKALINQFHDAAIQYNILKREVDTNRNLYDGLLERLRQTGVMAGFQFGNIHIIEAGRPSRVPASPKAMWILGIAAFLGLGLGICAVVIMDFWDTSISSLEEAELLKLPSLGSVPLIKASNKRSWPLLAGPTRVKEPADTTETALALPAAATQISSWELTESIRAICASILLSRSDQRPRLIVVTSAIPAEGKTTLVTHLGQAFAEAGLTTLLVEADLRKPDLSKFFSVGNEDGLSLYLAGHVSPWPKVHETSTPNLFVAAGGPIPPNPAALLHSDRLTQFLNAAILHYQVVLVDTPPLSMADARILGTKADGVVLVVRAGRTARNLVTRACTALDSAGVNVLGLVLNGEEPDPTSRSYYASYEYSHG